MSRQQYKFVNRRLFTFSGKDAYKDKVLVRAQELKWRENLITIVILLRSVLSEIL